MWSQSGPGGGATGAKTPGVGRISAGLRGCMARGWHTLSRKSSRGGGGRAGRGHAERALDVSPRAS